MKFNVVLCVCSFKAMIAGYPLPVQWAVVAMGLGPSIAHIRQAYHSALDHTAYTRV